MSEGLNKKQFFIISLMLFSMFFGAGNFIFPPMVGKDAGTYYYLSIMFFCLTAVLMPVVGVAAVAKAGNLTTLASRADKWFASVFVIAIYVSIGPLLAIPRAANMPFEISVMPFIDKDLQSTSIALYGALYFALNWYVCIYPSKMVEIIGKWLAPIMLILIVIFFAVGFFSLPAEFGVATGKYATHPTSSAFIDGYQTMDALAALVFGIIVASAMREAGVKDESHLASSTVKAGMVAGVILMIIYIMLGYLGASSASLFPEAKNGAELLSSVANYLFGGAGRVILGISFFLACFTTTTGLVSSVSSYFETIFPKINYKKWVLIWCIASFLVANLGLNQILKFSVPVLISLYPIAIILIILSLTNSFIDSNRLIYRTCVYVCAIVGIINALDISGMNIPLITDIVKTFPFYDSMLGWIVPTAVCFAITYLYYLLFAKKDNY